MSVLYRRFDVYQLSPESPAHDGRKGRPWVILSPDEQNAHISTIIVAPFTTQGQSYPTRIPCHIMGQEGFIALEQLRAIEKHRLTKKLGRLPQTTQMWVLETLAELFAK